MSRGSATRRMVAVLAHRRPSGACPPGLDPQLFRLALLEDTYEVVARLELMEAVLALCPGNQPDAEEITWPGTPILRIEPGRDAAETLGVLDGLADLDGQEGTVVADDAPDLPPLLVAKLHRALGSAQVAACPADGGGLVALATVLPPPSWLPAAGVGLDVPDAMQRLLGAAPSRRAVSVAPGWHRLRSPDDLRALDPGLEGWEVTRSLLGGFSGSSF